MNKKRTLSFMLSMIMALSVVSINAVRVDAATLVNIGYAVSRGGDSFQLPIGAVNQLDPGAMGIHPQKIYAKWRNSYNSMINNRLDLTFHIQDGLTYILSVENAVEDDIVDGDAWETLGLENTVRVELRVKDNRQAVEEYFNLSRLRFYDYNPKAYRSLSSTTITGNRRFKFDDANTTGVFLLKTSAGFSLSDDFGNLISFYWNEDSTFYVVVDNVNGLPTDGKIFDFTLFGEDYVDKAKPAYPADTRYVCIGYEDAITPIPYAKDDYEDVNIDYPGFHLDTDTYADAPDPSTEPGVRLYVDFPTFWDETQKKFVQKQQSADKKLTFYMRLTLNNSPTTDIIVPNIYAALDSNNNIPSQVSTNLNGSGSNVQEGTLNGKECIVFKFAGLDPGTVFNTAYLQLSCNEGGPDLLQNSRFDLDSKNIFTYPAYKIAADGSDDFYMEITPFKYANGAYISGDYTVYEMDFAPAPYETNNEYYDPDRFSYDSYKLESRYYKSGDENPRVMLGQNAKPSDSTLCWYFITFAIETSSDKLNSQFYRYQSKESDVRLGTPEIAEPIKSKVVSSLGDNNELLLTIDWKIGRSDILDNTFENLEEGKKYVDYVFKKGYTTEKSTNPQVESDFSEFVALRVTQVSKAPSKYVVSLAPAAEYPYNSKVQFITAADDSYYAKPLPIVAGKQYDNAYGHAEIKLRAYPIDEPGKPDNSFYFPDTCLIEAYATYTMKSADPLKDGEFKMTGDSVRKIITINALDTMEVPTPQNLKVTSGSATRTSFQISWQPVNTKEYETIEITPKQMALLSNYPSIQNPDPNYPDSVTYNMYISTNKNNMTMLADFFRSDSSLKNTAFYGDTNKLNNSSIKNLIDNQIAISKNTKVITSKSVLDMTNTATANDPEVPISANNGSTSQPGLRALRDGKILKIMNIKQVDTEYIVSLSGLDTNQVYYVMLETQASPYMQAYNNNVTPPIALVDENGLPVIVEDTGILLEKSDFSKFSVLITVTTSPDEESPDPSEIPPPSPTGIDKKDVTGNSATVFWNKMLDLSSNDYSGMKYQILRIRGDQLTTALVNSNIAADKFMAQLDSKLEPVIWQTKGESNLLTFDGNTFKLYNGGTTPSYEYLTTEKQHLFSDRSLKPNQLYMYYVRSVTLKPNETNPLEYTDDVYSHSVWVPVSVTTDPVHSPINLKIEQEKVVTPKTSTVISFDAPITKDKLGTSNYFGISITEEGTELPERVINTTADINALYASASESTEEGHTHFEYTITGLKPGKSYIIKIRMYDITLGDWSPYSTTARTRTEVDDADYDYNSDLDKWTTHYLSQIEALLKKPLWQTSDPTTSTTAFAAEIRASTFDAEMQKSTDTVVLLGQKGSVSQSYFIPLTVIQKANNAQKGFLISFGDQEILIQKSTFDTATTKEIQNALQQTTNTDVFIKIDASIAQYTAKVNETTPTSPSITVTYSVIGTRTTEKQWDKDIYAQLESYVKNPSAIAVFNSLLGQQLNAKATNEQLVKFVDQQVNNVKQTLITMSRNSFNNIINSTVIISATDKPFIVKSTVDDAAASGGYYYQNGSWLKQDQVSQYGNKAGIISNLAGMYIFAGNKVVVPEISGLQNIAELSGVYAKYGLNDYLGTDSVQINAGNASVGTVTGITARIMGAAKSDNPIDYLKSKGYQITAANNAANIQTQQAVYLLMALYEQKTNTKIDTLKIKNYNATANITGIDSKYNKSILAAIELGLVDSEVLQPRQAILTSDFIKMLAQLAKKVKL